jgi:IS1 family transposase
LGITAFCGVVICSICGLIREYAVEPQTGETLAYVLSNPQDSAFLELKAWLEPFGMTQFYTDGYGAYERHIDPAFHTVGLVHNHLKATYSESQAASPCS